MQDYPKSHCLYHPMENITNFCKQKSCLMPLCPTCICSHMDMHIQQGKNNPKFDNINQAFSNMTTQIRKLNYKFNDAQDKIMDVQRIIGDQKKAVSDLFYSIKVQVRDMVQNTFTQLQSEFNSAIDKQNETLGLHIPQSIQNLKKGIKDVSGKLKDMLGQLKTDKGLCTLITFNHQTLPNIEKYQKVIFQQIKNNEQYSAITTANQDAMTKIKQSIKQSILLKFNLPQVNNKVSLNITTEGLQQVRSIKGTSPKNISINVNKNNNITQNISSVRTPLSKTCLNSLRSSFGNKHEILLSGKFPTSTNPTTPVNRQKFFEPSLISSIQSNKRTNSKIFQNENRY